MAITFYVCNREQLRRMRKAIISMLTREGYSVEFCRA